VFAEASYIAARYFDSSSGFRRGLAVLVPAALALTAADSPGMPALVAGKAVAGRLAQGVPVGLAGHLEGVH